MLGDAAQINQTDRELLAWLDSVPFSKIVKNVTRDFSDAVLMAELLKCYYPRLVELHNYASASSLNAKRENWSTLNRKVLAKLDLKLNKDVIHHLANASPGSIEKLLWELRTKILAEGEGLHRSGLKCNTDDVGTKPSKEKIGDHSSDKDDPLDPPEVTAGNVPVTEATAVTDDESRESLGPSRLARFKQRIFLVFSWFIRFSLLWSIIAYCKPRRRYETISDEGKRSGDQSETTVSDRRTSEFLMCKGDAPADIVVATPDQTEMCEMDETMPRSVYAGLKQELREKEEVICTLNHKIAYLESSMKLKDLRISNLMEQIPQCANETDPTTAKLSRYGDNARPKLRSRSYNFQESKTY